jgi:aldehyde dehydrogenase (NAD+)
MQKEL